MVDGHWSPICGHWFWDNNYGTTLFCQMLDSTYTSGIVKEHRDIPLASDGMRIGKCTSNDNSLISCTGGCNDLELGGQCSNHPSFCGAGQGATAEIECLKFALSQIEPKHVTINPGKTISLKCSSTLPHNSCQFRHRHCCFEKGPNNNVISCNDFNCDDEGRYSFNDANQANTCEFSITNIKIGEDNGRWYCTLTEKFGKKVYGKMDIGNFPPLLV